MDLLIVILSLIGVIVLLGVLRSRSKYWAKAREELVRAAEIFDEALSKKEFNADIKLSVRVKYKSKNNYDAFRMYLNTRESRIALASLETRPIHIYYLNFNEIASFEILSGVQSSSSQGLGLGGATAGYGLLGGLAVTSSVTTVTVEKIKLKIDFKEKFKQPLILMLNTNAVDQMSEEYSQIVNDIESIKSMLTQIIAESQQEN